jgi:hypothetical protein
MIHSTPISKGSGTGQSCGASEVPHGMVAFLAMLSSAMGYFGPCRDMLGRLAFVGKDHTGVTSFPRGSA